MSTINFEITDQQHEWVYGPNGGRTGQWIISFTTSAGWSSQVIVGDNSYTPDNVAAMIAAEAATIDAVGSINSVEVTD